MLARLDAMERRACVTRYDRISARIDKATRPNLYSAARGFDLHRTDAPAGAVRACDARVKQRGGAALQHQFVSDQFDDLWIERQALEPKRLRTCFRQHIIL